ncbi:protein crumbs homolog 1-like [Coregonus clupeaformis]|uniref:protein crumbs homolog 1-like n=1 Tax=Coregonus clupeaformis TaxID=59861 RepID=UPI001BDFC8F6|nr:protein crumbs homolog 1-like [Coregonus clupeaformis]
MEFGRFLFKYQRTLLLTMIMFKLGILCTAADQCLLSPCQNGGTCVDYMGNYTCLCPRWPVRYTGKECRELYDPCVYDAPCANCTSTLGTGVYTCHCTDGFAGTNCTLNINRCLSNPCKGGVRSHCVDRVDGYTCHCPPGYGGEQCQERIRDCTEEPCHNDATCVGTPDGYECQCGPGFQGRDCEENIDDCKSLPCQNGAICKDGVNGYQCFCVPGFQGYHCDLDINECASRPCENNGTCVNEVDHYECNCLLGFKGVNCEVEIDDCEEQPCQNGATCHDHVGLYTCECVSGYEGHECELDIDECASGPCLNEGNCTDLVNSYECDCIGTGFTGEQCEVDIPECASDPCQNGATCLEGINQYSCACWPGYEGKNCQVDIDECELEPCENGGECFQRSELLHYGVLSGLQDREFNYEDAAGFLCHCQPGFAGESCELNVNECESAPCQNGGSCEDLVNSYWCVCLPGFTGVHCEVDIDECESEPCQNGGSCQDGANAYTCHCVEAELGEEPWGSRNCDVRLIGCREHLCENGATCVPILSQEEDGDEDGVEQEHGHTCLCPPGFTGKHCSIPTTFSFNTEGYVLIQLPPIANRSRREIDPHHQDHHGLHVQLRFKTTLPDMLLFYIGAEHYFVSLEIVGSLLKARARSGKELQATYHLPVNDGDWHEAKVTMDEKLVLMVKGPGCDNDEGCTVEDEGHNQLVFFQPGSFPKVYVGGAPQKYLDNTDSRKGFIGCMEDLHVDHQRVLPQDISPEHVQDMELGCNKTDWCHPDPCHHRGQCIDLWTSFSCECDRPYHGSLCEEQYPSWTFSNEETVSYAAFNINKTDAENFNISFFLRSLKPSGLLFQLRRGRRAYLTLYLREGTLVFNSPPTTLFSNGTYITSGQRELVAVVVRQGQVGFRQAGTQLSLGRVRMERGDVVYIGGLPPGESTAPWGGHFKGCLQDITLDRMQLYPNHTKEECHTHETYQCYFPNKAENVLDGCVSDEACKTGPCQNGGMCMVTWNDFECTCPMNFSGRRCDTRVWCVSDPCVMGSQCVDLVDGYECLTNATFESNALQFTANGSLVASVTSVSLDIRTRKENGVLLRATNGAEVFCLGLLNSSLLVKLLSGNSLELQAFTSDLPISDGTWHHLHLAMAEPLQPMSRWRLTVDGRRVGSTMGTAGNLNFLNDTTVWLAENYTGCLGEVRVGGVYLPLVDNQDAPQAAQFIRQVGQEPKIGCIGADLCQSQPCLNQGSCQDLWNLLNCSCAPGWEGQFCQRDTDECATGPCAHGTCTDLLADYQCVCQKGWGGRDCDEEVDDCLENSCLNGGSCLDGMGTYHCVCLPGYSGRRCQWRFPPQQCDEDTQCDNGGVCMDEIWGANCTCKPGYTGDWCEAEIDECESRPCLNGATCLDRLNSFQCVCVPGFSGTQCESNRQEQRERVPWLVVAIPLASLCVLLAVVALVFMVLTTRKKRQSEGTYSPSAQEVAGARLEMGSVLKVPPEERLI